MTEQDDEIDLLALVGVLREYKWLLALTTATCGLIAVVLALTADPVYRAVAVVTEVETTNSAGAASLLSSQLGGLANLTGITAQLRGSSRQAMAILESRHLAEQFIERHGLIARFSSDSEVPVTLWKAVERFRLSVITIEPDANLGRTTVVIDWTDPVVAAEWANAFIALANELIRTRAIDEAKRNIAYLEEQIAQTNVVDVQRVMYNLIQNETQTLMLAHARPEYAFRLVDPAVPPETRISPRRTFMVLLGLTVGMLGGIVVAFVHYQLRRRGVSARNVAAP
jgi:uncharacterized protein involved in exopolysaccharide biosynthesis